MRLRDRVLTPFRRLTAAPTTTEKPPAGEAGSETEDWLSDLRGGGPDVNPELTGSAKFDVYDEMRKTDPSVKSLLLYEKLPVRSAAWGLNPGQDGKPSEEPLALLVRDFVAWNLGLEEQEGQLDLSWDESLQQMLQLLEWGAMFEELCWGDPVIWRDADGDEHLVRPLARLAPRYPRSIDLVKMDKGRPVEVRQQLSNTRPIPGEKLAYSILEREGGRWDGVSLLRPCWGAWRTKKFLLISAGQGWDRFAFGMPAIWHPDTPEGEVTARSIGRDYRTGERMYLRFPVPQGGTKADSEWAIDILNGAQTMADPAPLLQWCSAQIAEAGLQHFSSLGESQHGSRAVAETQIDPFFLSVQALANYVRRERVRQVIKPIVRYNFGAEVAEHYLPLLTVSKIQARSVSVIARAIADLGNAGFTFTDREAQDDIRELLGLSKLPNDLAARGIDRTRLEQILRSAGLDPATFASIVNALPPELGVARNTVPTEGDGLPLGSTA